MKEKRMRSLRRKGDNKHPHNFLITHYKIIRHFKIEIKNYETDK